MSDDYIPLWKKAGIYDLLYEGEVTCEQALSRLTAALIDMCIHYIDYRHVVKLPPSNPKEGGFMDEILREQVFRQAVAILAMVTEATNVYSPSCFICREKEEAL